MDDKEHNGWTNRATWNVNLWLASDEEIYTLMSSLKMVDAAQFANFCGYVWGEETPDGENLSEVNWDEIASAWGRQD